MHTFQQRLKSLGAVCEQPLPDKFRHIVDDTREICPGDLFVLRQGAKPLTHEQVISFTQKAQDAGAAAIIADPIHKLELSIPVIALSEPHRKLQDLAEAFYGHPSHELKVIAVTGTNGKTTTTYLIEALAQAMGLKVGVLGTISHRYPGYEEASANTTPGTLKLYRLMRGMVEAGCDLVAMEVSSHGIMQGRIDGVAFDAAIWNNLGTDHLDFHITRQAYGEAKQRLFSHYLAQSFAIGKKPVAIPNADDPEVMSFIQSANSQNWGGKIASFSLKNTSTFQIQSAQWQKNAWEINALDNNSSYQTALPLVGIYNVANAAGALTAMREIGFKMDDMAKSLPKIAQIPGRMECVCTNPTVIVDFAHTPEALENAILAARECVPNGGKLWVIIGAGGDRDPSKRPIMGRIAAQYADNIVVTSDNPRTEDPQKIIQDILEGIPKNCEFETNIDRKSAIENAVKAAQINDVVLIAGKGHEDYQILGTTKIHFDDREIARNANIQ